MGNEAIQQTIRRVAAEEGLSPEYALAVAERESAFNPNAGGTGSIRGLYQFTGANRRKYGLADHASPEEQTRAFARLTNDLRAEMAHTLGRDPSHGELYTGHHFGGTRAARIASGAYAGYAPSDLFSPREMAGNPHFARARTGGELSQSIVADIDRRMAKHGGAGGQGSGIDFAAFGYDPNADEMGSGMRAGAGAEALKADQGMIRTSPGQQLDQGMERSPEGIPKQPQQQVPENELLPERPNFYQRKFDASAPRSKSVQVAGPNDAVDFAQFGQSAAPPQNNLLEQAREQYPVLKNHDIKYKENFGGGKGFLESWPAGEPGTADHARPKEFGDRDFGVEVYDPKTRPIDVLGDVTSHHLIERDPTVKKTYEDFGASLQPWQHDRLREQYGHAQTHEGETRPYEDWKTKSGLPAYFRGYPFQQWGDDAKGMYTPGQIKQLDGMMDYLRGGVSKPQSKVRPGAIDFAAFGQADEVPKPSPDSVQPVAVARPVPIGKASPVGAGSLLKDLDDEMTVRQNAPDPNDAAFQGTVQKLQPQPLRI